MSVPLFYYLSFTGVFILAGWALYLPYRMGQLHFLVIPNMVISAYFAAVMSGAVSGGAVSGAVASGSRVADALAQNPHWPFAAILLAAVVISALIGFLISLGVGDAPCFSVVIVGLTSMYLIRTIAENTGALGKTFGLFNVPRIINSAQGNRIFLVVMIYLILLLIGFLIYRFDKSHLGRAASLIFEDRDLALSQGVNVKRMGILLQTASSAMGGLAGVLYLYVTRSISPGFITFQNLGFLMTVLFVGGRTTQWGVLLAAPILWGLPLILPEGLQAWKNVFYAGILILILLLKPEGIITRPVLRNMSRGIQAAIRRKG